MEEVQQGLANQNTTDEEKVRLKLMLADLKERTEKISADGLEWKQRAHADEAEHMARTVREIEERLADPRVAAEDRANLERKYLELNKVVTERLAARGFGGPEQSVNGTLKLTAIKTERISETAGGILFPRLAIQPGDLITEETARRIIEAVKSVDEHFRVGFHPDGKGGVVLVIIAP
jgi:hypothetical protein